MIKMLTIKTGSPMRFTVKYYKDDGVTTKPLPTNIDFDVVHPKTGAVLANLNVGDGITKAGVPDNEYSIFFADTALWPIGKIPIDILYDKGLPTQRPTETIYINVEKGRTT